VRFSKGSDASLNADEHRRVSPPIPTHAPAPVFPPTRSNSPAALDSSTCHESDTPSTKIRGNTRKRKPVISFDEEQRLEYFPPFKIRRGASETPSVALGFKNRTSSYQAITIAPSYGGGPARPPSYMRNLAVTPPHMTQPTRSVHLQSIHPPSELPPRSYDTSNLPSYMRSIREFEGAIPDSQVRLMEALCALILTTLFSR
jgi:hypothetical protein